MKRIFLLGFLTVMSLNSWASCSGSNCISVTIDRLIVRSGGGVSIGTSGEESNLDCDSGNGYIELPADVDGFDQLYSLLLAAQTTKHPVWVRTNSAGECKVSYVVSDI